MRFKSKIISYFLVLVYILMIIIFPDVSSGGVSRGIVISANVIIPSLFPFMVCVLMFIKSGVRVNNRHINKIIFTLFGHNFDMFFAFLLSMLGGYPVGAKLINELYKQKIIDSKIADIMLMYCVNAGPAFIISVVGIGVFGSQKLGVVILLSHIISSLIIALTSSKMLKQLNYKKQTVTKCVKSFSQNLVESVTDASASILQICSFVIIFSSLNAYLDLFFCNTPIIKYIPYLTEVTSAVTKTKNIISIAFLLGFSGLSIWCQIFAVSSGRKINYIKFTAGRLLHGCLSAVFVKLFISIFKIKLTTFSNNKNIVAYQFYSDAAVSCSIAIMLIVLIVYIYTKNNSGKFIKDVI